MLNDYWISEAKRCLKMAWKHRNQRTWCFCPICHQDLCSTDSWQSTTGNIENFENYKCSRCGCESSWNYGIAPVPILISYQKLNNNQKQYTHNN